MITFQRRQHDSMRKCKRQCLPHCIHSFCYMSGCVLPSASPTPNPLRSGPKQYILYPRKIRQTGHHRTAVEWNGGRVSYRDQSPSALKWGKGERLLSKYDILGRGNGTTLEGRREWSSCLAQTKGLKFLWEWRQWRDERRKERWEWRDNCEMRVERFE